MRDRGWALPGDTTHVSLNCIADKIAWVANRKKSTADEITWMDNQKKREQQKKLKNEKNDPYR
jgi:hypothetical protein